MEALGRFELPTCGLGNRRSIHLSYRANPFNIYQQFSIVISPPALAKSVTILPDRTISCLGRGLAGLPQNPDDSCCAGGTEQVDQIVVEPAASFY